MRSGEYPTPWGGEVYSVLNSEWNCSRVPWSALQCHSRRLTEPCVWQARRPAFQPSSVSSGTISTRCARRAMPSAYMGCSRVVRRLPALGCAQRVAVSASSQAARAATAVLRTFQLISQSIYGNPCRLQASTSRIARAESKPESRCARNGAFEARTDKRWEIGTTRLGSISASKAESCRSAAILDAAGD